MKTEFEIGGLYKPYKQLRTFSIVDGYAIKLSWKESVRAGDPFIVIEMVNKIRFNKLYPTATNILMKVITKGQIKYILYNPQLLQPTYVIGKNIVKKL